MKLETILYDCKYTAGSYLDVFSSIPIWAAEKKTKIVGNLYNHAGKEIPNFLNFEYIKKKSPVYKLREKLRDSLDTRAGAVFLQSNILAALPFVAVGMPAAELAQSGIEKWISDAPKIIQYASNSTITLMTQMVMGYTIFMANEVRTNKYKYVDENGKIKAKKIFDGFKKAVKAFLSFDIPYIITKIGGQSAFLALGKAPWKASGLVDTIAFPAWYTFAIPLGLHKGIIEPKKKPKPKK